jgi:phenylacetate-CoA ligase
VTRKSELLERQAAQRPQQIFGGFNAIGLGHDMPRLFASPGPIYEPESRRPDYWRMARSMYAAGFGLASWCTTASAITSCPPAR